MNQSIALFILFVCGATAAADPIVSFQVGYPAAGEGKGEIQVRGTISLEDGWGLSKKSITLLAWEDGKDVSRYEISVKGNDFAGVLGGLKSGARHNILVEVTLRRGTETVTLVSEPASARAK